MKHVEQPARSSRQQLGVLTMQKTRSILTQKPLGWRRPSRRCCLYSCALLVLWLLALGLGLPGQAAQQNCPALPGGTAPVAPPTGGFSIDGDLFANTPANKGDWMLRPTSPPAGSGTAVLDAAGNPLNPTLTFHLVDPFNSGTDNNFGPGISGCKKADDNPTCWTWVSNPVNNKQDINNALIHITTDANNHTWIVISADRLSDNGNAYIDFEFLQNPLATTTNPDGLGGGFSSAGPNCGRTVNDFILTINFINGGTQPGMCFQRWLPSAVAPCGYDYFDQTSLLPAGRVFAAVNTTNISVPYGAFGTTTYSPNTFAEAAVDLTALIADIDPCLSIGVKTLFVKTKESQAPNATIVDFISPVAVKLKLGPTADAGPDLAKCSEGSSTTFNLTGTETAGTYTITNRTWSVVSGTATIDSPNSLTTAVHVSTASATLRLTIKDNHGCVNSDDLLLTVNPAPPCGITGAAFVFAGSSGNPYSGPSGAGLTYAWSLSGASGVTINGSTTSQSILVHVGSAASGTFTLTLKVTGAGGCMTTCSIPVDIQPHEAGCQLSGPFAVCTGSTLNTYTLTSGAPGTSPSYAWSLVANSSGATFNPAPSSSSTSVKVDAGGAGSYTVHVVITFNGTASLSCEAPTTVNPLPVCSITGPTPVCPSSTHTYSYGGPAGTYTFAWQISGNGTIPGAKNGPSVDVLAGSACNQNFTLTLTVTSNGCSSTCSQPFLVNDTTKPVISGVGGPATIECPATPVFSEPTASDDCGSATLTHEDVTTPGSCANNYSVKRTWTATDSCGNTATASQTITVQDTTKPTISGVAGPATIECPASPVFTEPTASDLCGTATLTHEDVTTPGSCPNNYSVKRTLTATDLCGNTATASQTITVQDTTKPTISGVGGPATIECSAPLVFTEPTASDLCGSATLTHEDVTTPGSCPNNYSVKRTWTATDLCGNTATASQTITVQDTTKPTISGVGGPATIECSAPLVFSEPTASDACGTATLTHDDVTTPGSCPNNYSVKRTWTATDLCGNTATASQTITLQDTTKPTISGVGGPATIECPSTPVFTEPTASDDCGTATLTHDDVTTPGSCPNNYSVKRTWTATDLCGNTATASQTITLQDTTNPTISGVSGPATIECSAPLVFSEPTASDACGTATLTHDDVTTPGSCPNNYSVKRTWTATDLCGNTATASQTITLQDTTKPTISGVGGPATIECSAPLVFSEPTASDACGTATLTHDDVTTPGSCPNNYSVKRTWTATDLCGNTATASQTITL